MQDVKRAGKPVLRNGSAAVWDIGDGVLCFEFTSKMNSLDPDIFDLLGKTLGLAAKGYRGIVVHNEGEAFSVGANLGIALFAANVAAWPVIEQQVAGGQAAYKAMKYAPVPVVAAPSGMALGGGCRSPAAALAVMDRDRIRLRAEILSEDGGERVACEARLEPGDGYTPGLLACDLLERASPPLRALFAG